MRQLPPSTQDPGESLSSANNNVTHTEAEEEEEEKEKEEEETDGGRERGVETVERRRFLWLWSLLCNVRSNTE